MRFFILIVLIFSALTRLCAAGDSRFSLDGETYMQRAILSYGGVQTPLTVYVKTDSAGNASVVIDSSVGMLAQVTIDSHGGEVFLKTSEFFPERLARKFILRDIRAVRGFLGGLGADTLYINSNNLNLVSKISCKDYTVEFSDYARDAKSGKFLPTTVEISAAQYSIKLTLAMSHSSK